MQNERYKLMGKRVHRVLPKALTLRMSVVLCLLLSTAPLSAKPISKRNVTAAVETWLRRVITDVRADATVESAELHIVDGETVAYIVRLVGGGFCLSGADDLVLPVYFYSPEGVYDPDNPGHKYILWEIGARLGGLQQSLSNRDPGLEPHQIALADRARFWDDLTARRIPQRGGIARAKAESEQQAVDPPMLVLPFNSTWGQGSPYNDQCPDLLGHAGSPPPPEVHTKVGCVATAMSQIMYYWKWPESGTGYHGHTQAHYRFADWESTPLATDPGINASWWDGRLEWSDASLPAQLRMGGDWDNGMYQQARGILDDSTYRTALAALYSRADSLWFIEEADFSAATYNWDLMHDVHADGDGVSDDEVAKLCYHAGVAVSMDWGFADSSSLTGDVADAMPAYFRYDPDALHSYLNVNSMTTEIQWLRPFQLRGGDANGGGGHSWVVYGYDTSTDPDRRFLMNFGWNGSGDGWYSYDSITPNSWEFTVENRHVTRIAPRSVVGFVGSDYPSSDGSPGSPYKNLADAAANAPDGATLIFKTGRDDTFVGGSLVVDRPFTLKGYDIRIFPE